VITGMLVDYVDDSGSGTSNGSVYLTRMPLLARGGTYNDLYLADLANVTTGGTAVASHINAVADSQPVDKSKWAYTIIGFQSTANSYICAIDINYTVSPGFSGASEAHVA